MQTIKNYEPFEQVFLETLIEQAPLKKKFLKANHVPYMVKSLRKSIMRRSEFESNHTVFFISNAFFQLRVSAAEEY